VEETGPAPATARKAEPAAGSPVSEEIFVCRRQRSARTLGRFLAEEGAFLGLFWLFFAAGAAGGWSLAN
jgi:hypothetical protein